MRLRLLYLVRNLTRNWRRTFLTCAAVGLPIAIYVLATAVVDGIERFLDNSARQLRLAVLHKTSIVNPLPAGHRTKIERLDESRARLLSVCGIQWIGGKVEGRQQNLSTLAADADTFVSTFPEYNLRPDQIEAWLRDRQAIILGGQTAAQFRWKEGDRITIWPSTPPYEPMQFHVIDLADDVPDPVTNWFRRDYLDEELDKRGIPSGRVSFFFVKCATKADLDHYRAEIDRLFAGTLDETTTLDERSFMNQFITQQFNLPRNLAILSAVTVFVAIMAAANTMGMNFRDRINEFATLKALGFGRGLVFALIQMESLLLCGIGGLCGAAIPYVAFTYTPLRSYKVPLIEILDVRPEVCGQGVAIALAVGLVAGVWPSLSAARLKVVSALRSLE